MRPHLCAHMVSLQAHHEKQMLHHLQDIQLGSFDDVLSPHLRRRFLQRFPRPACHRRMARMGSLHNDLSRTLLGNDQRRPQMLRMHRQALHAVLSEAEEINKQQKAFCCFCILLLHICLLTVIDDKRTAFLCCSFLYSLFLYRYRDIPCDGLFDPVFESVVDAAFQGFQTVFVEEVPCGMQREGVYIEGDGDRAAGL